MKPSERKYAQAFARLGGKARAKALTKERRQEIARMGARARWNKVLASKQATT
jgi:general stress protein YciG